MIRCVHCGHLLQWSPQAIVACGNCEKLVIMPDEQTARVMGVFAGVIPPYVWTLRQDEVFVLLDGLECLMATFAEALQQGESDQGAYTALVGSYAFAKMTRQRLLGMVPDVRGEVESVG